MLPFAFLKLHAFKTIAQLQDSEQVLKYEEIRYFLWKKKASCEYKVKQKKFEHKMRISCKPCYQNVHTQYIPRLQLSKLPD